MMLVGLGRVTMIPSGTTTYTVCEYPSFIASRVLGMSGSDHILVFCGQPMWVRLERCAEANAEEVHGKRKPCCLARDGICDECAGRPPHHMLGLFCWVNDEYAWFYW